MTTKLGLVMSACKVMPRFPAVIPMQETIFHFLPQCHTPWPLTDTLASKRANEVDSANSCPCRKFICRVTCLFLRKQTTTTNALSWWIWCVARSALWNRGDSPMITVPMSSKICCPSHRCWSPTCIPCFCYHHHLSTKQLVPTNKTPDPARKSHRLDQKGGYCCRCRHGVNWKNGRKRRSLSRRAKTECNSWMNVFHYGTIGIGTFLDKNENFVSRKRKSRDLLLHENNQTWWDPSLRTVVPKLKKSKPQCCATKQKICNYLYKRNQGIQLGRVSMNLMTFTMTADPTKRPLLSWESDVKTVAWMSTKLHGVVLAISVISKSQMLLVKCTPIFWLGYQSWKACESRLIMTLAGYLHPLSYLNWNNSCIILNNTKSTPN